MSMKLLFKYVCFVRYIGIVFKHIYVRIQFGYMQVNNFVRMARC